MGTRVAVRDAMYGFVGALALLAAWRVVSSGNAVYSLLYLVLAYCGTVCLMLGMGAGYMGLIVLVVYVGAIAVIFTFVVMMVGETGVGSREVWVSRVGGCLSGLLGGWYVLACWRGGLESSECTTEWYQEVDSLLQVESLGQVLYGYSWVYVVLGGMVLLVAMLSAMMVTRRPAVAGGREQSVHKQLGRASSRAVVRLRQCG